MLRIADIFCVVFLFHYGYSVPVLDDSRAIGRKEGHCPMILPESIGQCSNMCVYDSDCEDNRKCCLNGCGGTSCIPPQSDPCVGYQCPRQGQACVSLLTHAVCLCNTHCPDVSEPVCGSDGNTYSNKCYLDAHACELAISVDVVPCNEETLSTDAPLSTDSPSGPQWPLPGYDEDDDDEEDDTEDDSFWWDEKNDDNTNQGTSTEDKEGDDDYEDVIPPGAPSLVTQPGEVIAFVGDPANIECDVIGNPAPSKFWQKDDKPMFPGQTYGEIFVSEKGVLHFPSAVKEYTGNYVCMAVNTVGSLAAVYALKVIERPDESEVTTEPDTPALNAVCYEPLEKGTCHHYQATWYYNQETKMCEVFVYGGCDGNNNRFSSYEQCRAACPLMPENRCQHPLETGPCRGYFRRWGWDATKKECVSFVYGGCLGNENNFDDQESCTDACQGNEVTSHESNPDTNILDMIINDESPKQEYPIPEIVEIKKPAIGSIQLTSVNDKAVLPVSEYTGPRECDDCEPETSLHDSFCRKDFAISGKVTQLRSVDDTSVKVTIAIDGRYKNTGLEMPVSDQVIEMYLRTEAGRDCLCPAVRSDGESYIFMGQAVKGADGRVHGVIGSSGYLRTLTDHRRDKLMKLRLNPVFECDEKYSPYL
ncbi:WAP, Kazal, immunoglobulin, Kunitz and NTR domain-containing protein 1-like [Saccoglossus kowalevskii]|uniref:WAP, Kazal, immunoglobulin, Kunitz and NTR domain-containing protein-like n=1 Tax=Saccoglossus kowalevskii TaxID=10224 RepID=A0ABM0GLQ4_SACKO|nr:PREDICTED: WAP, Kazal, immunoglobulin, Kunitz and NTR domain-containing protein-like [Saccoglossus kowalevskii]